MRISSPSTPLTTGDAFRISEMMSSRASAPACRRSGVIGPSLTRRRAIPYDRSGYGGTARPLRHGLRRWIAAAALAPAGGGVREDRWGAVEISWVVRSRSGAAITDCSCAEPRSPQCGWCCRAWGSLEGYRPCDGQAQCDFPCPRQTGSTAFDIRGTQPGETYEISVVAVDSSGMVLSPDPVMTPAPILRSVIPGQPTETEAFQLVAACSVECGMNGSGVCARP